MRADVERRQCQFDGVSQAIFFSNIFVSHRIIYPDPLLFHQIAWMHRMRITHLSEGCPPR